MQTDEGVYTFFWGYVGSNINIFLRMKSLKLKKFFCFIQSMTYIFYIDNDFLPELI